MTAQAVVIVAVLLLAVWGVHRLLTLGDAIRPPLPRQRRGLDGSHAVTVQVPLYNEPHVASRVVDAVCSLRHQGLAGFEVQILDDSSDETTIAVAAVVARWRARGIDVTHLRRPTRDGFKAGALAWGLTRARGDLVAIFDADFVPAPDFLERIVPLFDEESMPDMVQARWGHLNRDESWLTRAQAALLDAHFHAEQRGRAASGRFFGFNGTAGVWRRSAIERAGGWEATTLTEDLDLSVRAWLVGCRFAFADDVEVLAELPARPAALRTQQRRWARGGVETARVRLKSVWRSPRAWHERLDLTLKLTQNAVHPVLFVLVAALPAAALERAFSAAHASRVLEGAACMLGLVPAAAAMLWSLRRSGVPSLRAAADTALAIGLAAALSASCAGAVVAGAFGLGPGVFERTPKSGGQRAGVIADPPARRLTWAVAAEGLLGALHLAVAVVLVLHGAVWVTPFLWLCGGVCLATVVAELCDAQTSRRALSPLQTIEHQGKHQGSDHDGARPDVLLPRSVTREAEHGLVQQR